jgi:hypothetical protein
VAKSRDGRFRIVSNDEREQTLNQLLTVRKPDRFFAFSSFYISHFKILGKIKKTIFVYLGNGWI